MTQAAAAKYKLKCGVMVFVGKYKGAAKEKE